MMRTHAARSTRPEERSRGSMEGDARPAQRAFSERTLLTQLVPLWPCELDDVSPAGRLRLLVKLRKALRTQRQKGLMGHWTYDLAKHAQLLAVYRAEIAMFMANRTAKEPITQSQSVTKAVSMTS